MTILGSYDISVDRELSIVDGGKMGLHPIVSKMFKNMWQDHFDRKILESMDFEIDWDSVFDV